MRGETVAQRVRVDDFLEGGLLDRTFAGMVDRLGRDGPIAGVSIPARKQPYAGLASQPTPVLTEFSEQHRTEHYVPVSAALAPSDVNHHALTVDVTHFQAREFGTPESGSIESHQQSAM
jgi:hypothetical protein